MTDYLEATLDGATGLRIMCGAPDCRSELGKVWWLAEPRVEIRDRVCPTHGRNEIRVDHLQAEWDSRHGVPGLGIRPAGTLHRRRAEEAGRSVQDAERLPPVDRERTDRLGAPDPDPD